MSMKYIHSYIIGLTLSTHPDKRKYAFFKLAKMLVPLEPWLKTLFKVSKLLLKTGKALTL